MTDKLRDSNTSLEKQLELWEKCYQEIFGEQEMIYNVHVFTHAVLIRNSGAFPTVSAFPFEDLYSAFKKNYADGTFNKPKQILYNLFASMFAKEPCICRRPLHLETEAKNKTDDSHIYCFDGEYKLYKIDGIGRNSVSASRMETGEWVPLYRMPSFSIVGIFKVKGYSTEVEDIPRATIKGKVVIVGEYACTVPKIVLDESV